MISPLYRDYRDVSMIADISKPTKKSRFALLFYS